jgi:hypothetical protein
MKESTKWELVAQVAQDSFRLKKYFDAHDEKKKKNVKERKEKKEKKSQI